MTRPAARPASRIAGFGFRKDTNLDSLLDALMMAGGPAGLTALTTVAAKADAHCMHALAERLALPITPVAAEDLACAEVATISQKSINMYGTGSVSEAAALIAAGAGAKLLAPRTLSADKRATCAIAEGLALPDPIAEGPRS